LQSFGKLVEDLDAKGIVTKRRDTKVKKFNGGIPFTYGPLAYFLKNRIYIGETGHKEKWFPGEHAAIVDRKIFDQVQQLLASQPAGRKARRTASEALLMSKLYDDRGNRMSPSFSSKNGVRYRFYVSSALLRGRKTEAGSVGRVASSSIEKPVIQALRTQVSADPSVDDATLLDRHLSHIELSEKQVILFAHTDPQQPNSTSAIQIKLPWSLNPQASFSSSESDAAERSDLRDPKAVQAIVRAHRWATALEDQEYASVEELAASTKLHPKSGEKRIAPCLP
jgi:site-specific DNA recombinase